MFWGRCFQGFTVTILKIETWSENRVGIKKPSPKKTTRKKTPEKTRKKHLKNPSLYWVFRVFSDILLFCRVFTCFVFFSNFLWAFFTLFWVFFYLLSDYFTFLQFFSSFFTSNFRLKGLTLKILEHINAI